LGPIGDQIAERLTPPAYQKNGSAQIPPQVQQQIQHLTQQLTQAAQIIKEKQVEAASRENVARIQAESAQKVAWINARAKLIDTDAKVNAAQAQSLVEQDYAASEHALDLQQEMDLASLAAQQAQRNLATQPAAPQ
jgi:hypothetical protein